MNEKFKLLIDRINRERKRTRNAKSSMRIVWFYGIGLALISALLVGFLSCLCGSQHAGHAGVIPETFLSCLCGSQLIRSLQP